MQSSQSEPSPGVAEIVVPPVRETRVDGPHIPLSGMNREAAWNDLNADPAGEIGLIQRIRCQTEQLARHLRDRQREIDRREAAVHAQAAELAHQQRSMRLWIAERTLDLAERESAKPDQRSGQTSNRKNATSDRDASVQIQEIEQRREQAEQMIQQALAMVEARRNALEEEWRRREVRWSEPHPGHAERQRQLDVMSQGLLRREERLARAEQIVQAQMLECDERQRDLERRSRRLRDQAATIQKNYEEERRRGENELKWERDRLQRRAEELDVKSAAVEKLREDVTRLHREALELRMATEETWAQLAGAMAPAKLTESLARIRARLADHDRLAQEELAVKLEDLRTISDRVQREHDRLKRYRDEVQSWAASRQGEIEIQAKRLVEREQELDGQESRLAALQDKWRRERRGYQDEIQRLLRIRDDETADVP